MIPAASLLVHPPQHNSERQPSHSSGQCAGRIVRMRCLVSASIQYTGGHESKNMQPRKNFRYEPATVADVMTKRDIVLGKHREAIKTAARQRAVTKISLTGSVARGDDGPNSDCDFLVEYPQGVTLFELVGLRADLEEIIGCGVDVIPTKCLGPPFTEMIGDGITL